MWLPESESPATLAGRGADNAKSFRGLISQNERYIESPSLASVSDEKARKRAAIAWRYREDRKRRGSAVPPIVWLRLAELERIIDHRWNGVIPATPDGQIFVRVAINHLVGFSKNWRKRLDTWCEQFAPWLDEDVLDEIVDLAAANPTQYKADSIARVIELDIVTRDLLKITTIGACDFDAIARKKRRREDRAARQRQKRAARGVKPHAECASRRKPWLAEGISERTWYRRKKEKHS